MSLFDRRQRANLDQLEDAFQQSRIGRREFIQRAMALGVSTSIIGSFLAACGSSSGSTPASGTTNVDLLTTWGSTELDSFNAVVMPFQQQSGIQVAVEGTRDLNTVLTTRVRGNDPPNIAILPNPGKMQELAKQGALVPLDSILDSATMQQNYSKAWIDLGTYNGKLYAIFYKAANKATVWYNPAQFQSNNFQTPKTWSDLTALSDQIAGSGKFPWSMGVESGSASGWPATDWMAEIYINESGPQMYDKWVAHQIPWTDPSIKSAWQKFGAIAGGKHYINGAPQSILATNFQNATYPPFQAPPQAYMNYLGDFAAGFISTQFPSAKAGTDYDFFPFPTINSAYQGAATGGADLVTVLKDSASTRQLVQYLSTADAQTIWVKRGGFTAVNKNVSPSAYPDPVTQRAAQGLASATSFRFGAGDSMPSAMQQAWWKAVLAFIADQTQLDSILSSLESTAQQAYHS